LQVSEERLDNVAASVKYAVINGLAGDYVEAGVWRGGCSLFAAHAIKLFAPCGTAYQPHVWMADSFKGFPEHREEDKALISLEEAKPIDKPGALSVGGVETVRELFEQYGMLEPGSPPLHFLTGWFKDTLPTARVEAISVLRADGDLYSSTMDIFNALFHRVVPCGVVIIDDYGHWPQCKKAVVDFFTDMNYAPRLCAVDYTAVWFQNTHGLPEGDCPMLPPPMCTRWIDFGSDV
jgi:O-methyltransferase